jgi:hypothetical protein
MKKQDIEEIENIKKETLKAKKFYEQYKSEYNKKNQERLDKLKSLAVYSEIKIGDIVLVKKVKNIQSTFNPKWVDEKGVVSVIKPSYRNKQLIFYYTINAIKSNGEPSKRRLSSQTSAMTLDEFEVIKKQDQ